MVAALAGLIAVAPAAAISPCATLQYAVASSGTRCNVTLQNDPSLTIGYLWWLNSGNGSYDRASSHVNRTATSAEPVTYLDRDGNGAVSRGDVIEVYTGTGCGGNLPVILGPDTSSASPSQVLLLQDGFQTTCSSASGDPTLLIVVSAVALAAVAGIIGFALTRRRNR